MTYEELEGEPWPRPFRGPFVPRMESSRVCRPGLLRLRRRRAARHFADSFATIRLAIARALIAWLPRCPFCHRTGDIIARAPRSLPSQGRPPGMARARGAARALLATRRRPRDARGARPRGALRRDGSAPQRRARRRVRSPRSVCLYRTTREPPMYVGIRNGGVGGVAASVSGMRLTLCSP
jgi:hypothetical protein